MTEQHELALNISQQELVIASYVGNRRETLLRVSLAEDWQRWLLEFLSDQKEGAPLHRAMATSIHPPLNEPIAQLLSQNDIELTFLTHHNSSIKCEEGMEAHRIANAYGARAQFPGKNVIIIAIGTLITFDRLSPEGALLKGITIPGLALDSNVDKLVRDIEQIVKNIKQEFPLPSSVVATGAILGEVGEVAHQKERSLHQRFKERLKEFVDSIEPELTLHGIHTALKEHLHEYTP